MFPKILCRVFNRNFKLTQNIPDNDIAMISIVSRNTILHRILMQPLLPWNLIKNSLVVDRDKPRNSDLGVWTLYFFLGLGMTQGFRNIGVRQLLR